MKSFCLAVALFVGAGATHSQTHPSFAGDWAIASSGSTAPLPFGRAFTAQQTQDGLAIHFSTNAAGRSGPENRTYDLVFAFDGTRTDEVTIAVSESNRHHLWDTASWNDGQLIVDSYWDGTLSKRRVISRHGDALGIDTTTFERGQPTATSSASYQRR